MDDITIAQVREAKKEAEAIVGKALMNLWRRGGLMPQLVSFEVCGITVGFQPTALTGFEVQITLAGP